MPPLSSLDAQLAGHSRLLVAYSGGLDSTVLLHQLVQLRISHPNLQLRAIHIHHGLSPFADSWQLHCQQQCAEWQLPLLTEHVAVDGREQGIEAAARSARYAAFRRHLQPGETLLTAQHLDDQCETLLLALKRGSGPAGLAAMPARLTLGENLLLRPLLTQTRGQLEQWAQQHQLSWIEDESNQDLRYDRNFLRQQVLPLLHQRWPHFAQASARSAALCGEQEQLLDELLAESLAAMMQTDGSLLIAPLQPLSEARRNALLRRWISAQGGQMPSRDAVQRIWHEVIDSREDASPCLRLGNHQIRRYRQAIYWLPLYPSLRDCVIAWQSPWQPLLLPQQLGTLCIDPQGIELRQPRADDVVTIRFYAQGDFHIVGRAGSRAIKKLWQEFAVPVWQRERTPLLFYGEKLIAALGVFVTHEGRITDNKSWRISWLKP
ncbi:tRNA(Ile)-lysidine synthase [Erwinia toletana]|uniref:tRNA(Ile)-lysidine synthase n=1 Tax=Winslowiella toletana TaxID=92490 RepID=A0ABS4PCQ0_9GAMM|nr:tRNA lysidine(34) synthetase TilS [Winslowiella toletana]MBP2169900.1 tRNA(Ile)-lysidine synthase [Winslowiella toletana]